MVRIPRVATPDPRPTLLQRIAGGDVSAVAALVDTYGGLIRSLALRFAGSEAEADEAVQDAFVLLWRKAGRFDPARGDEVTFVSVLTRRILIDRYRRRSPVRPTGNRVADDGAAGDHAVQARELFGKARHAFEDLDEAHRTALRLSIERGHSHAQIAEITGSPIGTVKSRIRNGLRHLRSRLGERHPPGVSASPSGIGGAS